MKFIEAKIKSLSFSLHGTPYFLFTDVLKKWSFQKNRSGIWSFWYCRERWYFFSPKIWSYHPGGKRKVIFLKKILGNFLPSFWKNSLFKRTAPGYDLSCMIWKHSIFSRKHDIFSLDGKWDTWKYDTFCVHVQVLRTWPHASLPKKIKDDLIPQKHT